MLIKDSQMLKSILILISNVDQRTNIEQVGYGL